MKKALLLLVIGLLRLAAISQNVNEPEALGLPGDNLNLYAVLDVFQKSRTLEDFEKAINDKNRKINNLDLNGDTYIDYIKVVSEKDVNSHAIILQVPINAKENQDVAVINVSKDSSGKISVQIIGDADLYGQYYVVESSSVRTSVTPNPGYAGEAKAIIPETAYTSVDGWPIVLYLFSPVYVVYRSPWYWGYYPNFWHPWYPVFYHDYWGYHYHYFRNNQYHRTLVVLNPVYYNHYYPRRSTSTMVMTNKRNGSYNATYNGRNYRKPTFPSRNGNTAPSMGQSLNKPRVASPNRQPVPIRPTAPTINRRMPNREMQRPSARPVLPTSKQNPARPTSPSGRRN
ncbi:hypothetical protein [Flavobacterium psychrotolerans]|nr:hypothetical protein [Flavobacterium psychrotolerans]